jgi:Mpv17 / PMP22 family
MATSNTGIAFYNQAIAVSAVSHMWEWYRLQLDVRPVMTKCFTTSLIQFLGDFIAQSYERLRIRNTQKSNVKGLSVCLDVPAYNPRRGLSLAADGMLLSGPLLHFAFELMEHVLPSHEDDSKSWISTTTILHVLANDFVVDTIYLFLSFIFVALAEGLGRDLPNLIRRDFPATIQASWGTCIVFMPVEYLCFSKLPLSLRVLSMNLIDVLWGSIISYVTHRSRRPHETDMLEQQKLQGTFQHDTTKLE